jgi:hypothetical protein
LLCANPKQDANHCGACNKACPPGEACQNGACAPCPNCPLWGHSTDVLWKQVAVDAKDNVYLAGTVIRSFLWNGSIVPLKGKTGLFITKQSNQGSVLWSTTAHSSGVLNINSFVTAPDGSLYIAGDWSDKATFGSTTLTAKGSYDGFVARLDPKGNWQWLQAFGGSELDSVRSIHPHPNGNITLAILTQGDIRIGGVTHTASVAQQKQILHIAQFDSNRRHIWTHTLHLNQGSLVSQMASDANDNIYIAVSFSGTFPFGNQTFRTNQLINTALLTFSPKGQPMWARHIKALHTAPYALRLTPKGELFLSGSFSGTLTTPNKPIPSKGLSDVFVSKWDRQGSPKWFITAGGPGSDTPTRHVIDTKGRLFIGIKYARHLTVGKLFYSSPNKAPYDGVIAQLETSTGTWKGMLPLDAPQGAYPATLALDAQQNLWLAGYFTGQPMALSKRLFPASPTGSHGFVVKMASPSLLCPTHLTNCNNTCVALTINKRHCGACNHQCPSGQTCQNGTCN